MKFSSATLSLLGAGVIAAAAFAAVVGGLVQPPDLEALLADVAESLGSWTYALVAGLAFLETGAFVGLVAQGEISLGLIVPLAWLAAALGDLASFALGRRLGRRFLLARGPRLGVTAGRLERVEGFFEEHGPKAILLGRFIGIVRAVAPFLAGASGMRLRAFLPWSLLGTAVWATTFTLIGYAFHESFASATKGLTYGALGVALLAAGALAWRHRRRSLVPCS